MKSFLLSALFFLSDVCLLQAGEPATDLDRMQGSWQVISLTENGKPVPAKEVEILEVVILKDRLTVREKGEKGKVLVDYTIKLDPAKTPKTIDFTPRITEAKEKKEKLTTELGIYAFDKDVLKLALDEEGKTRPTVFEGKETASYSVMVLKRNPLAPQMQSRKHDRRKHERIGID